MGVALVSSWPTGHAGGIFSDPPELEALSTRFLAERARRDERVLFVAEAPTPRRWPEELVEQGVLVLGSVGEVYAPLRDGDVTSQRSVFAEALAGALRDGFQGLCVAADNTGMVIEGLDRWLEWEQVAAELMADSPVNGLCCFDRTLLALGATHRLALVHPTLVGEGAPVEPSPQGCAPSPR
jgi:hypothetical protein